MRARMAIAVAGIEMELREVMLRDKPPSMLEASSKGTVPVVVLPNGSVLHESLDVMRWALAENDPEAWLSAEAGGLIGDNDGPFKHHLDRFKYATRYEDTDPVEHRTAAEPYLLALDARLRKTAHLMGETRSFADIAIFPFVRQFSNAAGDWMKQSQFDALNAWLELHVTSDLFLSVMRKYPQWHAGDDMTVFPSIE